MLKYYHQYKNDDKAQEFYEIALREKSVGARLYGHKKDIHFVVHLVKTEFRCVALCGQPR